MYFPKEESHLLHNASTEKNVVSYSFCTPNFSFFFFEKRTKAAASTGAPGAARRKQSFEWEKQ
jgi:hypothetical protein